MFCGLAYVPQVCPVKEFETQINQNTMNLIKIITDKLCRKPLLVKPAVTISCEPKTPIMATNVSYSNGRFRRYVNFTCPKCNKERSEAVWSDMEHIDPDTYDCDCGEVLKIWVKEHRTTFYGHTAYLGCSH